jgi:small subunit ribosomal protein S19e
MPSVYDIHPDKLIKKLADHLKQNFEEVTPPSWAFFTKTAVHRERPPQDREWWYIRCASLLRKLYIIGPIGISRMRKEYGGRKRKGRHSERTWKGGGASVRNPLQQLEKIGLVEKKSKEGRQLTSQGRSLLDKLTAGILNDAKTSAKEKKV